MAQITKSEGRIAVDKNPLEAHFSLALKKGSPVLEGLLLKKNRWLMK
jgi:hypothetical protein